MHFLLYIWKMRSWGGLVSVRLFNIRHVSDDERTSFSGNKLGFIN